MTHWKYFCLWHTLAVPFIVILQSFLLAKLPNILSVVRRSSSFDCDFLDVILFVALSSKSFILWSFLAVLFILALLGSSSDYDTPWQSFQLWYPWHFF